MSNGPATPSPDQEQQAKVSIFNIGGQLQQMNKKLLADEDAVRQMSQAGTPATVDTANQLLTLRKEFESILDKYTTAYRALFGTTPSGFSGLRGLGADPITWAIVVGFIAIAAGLIAAWISHEAVVSKQIAVDQQRAATAGALVNQAAGIQQQITDANARGDTATAAQLTQQYQQLLKLAADNNPNPNDWGAFLQNNWGWAAAAVAGIVLLKNL
jgi:hypothetical protein